MDFNEFEYTIREDDRTVDIIRDKEMFFDLEKTIPNSFSNDIKQLAINIFRDEPLFEDYEFSREGFDYNYLMDSKKRWKELGLELPKIRYYNKGFNPEENIVNNHLTLKFLRNLKVGDPTDIPIVFTDGSEEVTARASYFYLDDRISVIFKDVVLPKVEKKACSVIYAHELTHVALDEALGGVDKYTNRETLPILIEFIFGDSIDKETIDRLIKRRLAYLASVIADIHDNKDMPFVKRIKLESYLTSIIQGISLFNIYKESDSSKNEMITDINRVFKEEILTEDIIDKYDADYNKVDLNVKTLKKQMIRR